MKRSIMTLHRCVLAGVLLAAGAGASFAQPKWLAQNSGTGNVLNSISFLDSLTGVAMGPGGTIVRTTDGGATWTPIPSRDSTSYYSADVSPNGQLTAVGSWEFFYECGRGTIQRSNDGGASWTVVSPDTLDWWNTQVPTLQAVSTPSDSEGYAILACDDFACPTRNQLFVCRTTNGGRTWNDKPPVRWCFDTDTWGYWGISFRPGGVGLMVGPGGLILRTTDSAETYTIQPSGTTVDLLSVDHLNDSCAVAVGDAGTIIRTTDGGLHWNLIRSGDLRLGAVRFADSLEGFATGQYGTVLRTTDGGMSWLPESSGVWAGLGSISFPDRYHVWIGGEGGTILKRNFYRSAIRPAMAYHFGTVNVDSARTDSVPVVNNGLAPIALRYSTDSPEFMTADSGQTVSPGDTGYIRILIAPVGPGLKRCWLTIDHDIGGSAWKVFLDATGLEWDTSRWEVSAAWNLVSIHRRPANDSASAIFPSAVTGAYRYDREVGYTESIRLIPGTGYWMKFPAADSVTLSGYTILDDTIDVKAGWNLIGTIASSVPAASVTTSPPSIILSPFFYYETAYQVADTLAPGRAYWVKVGVDGRLFILAR